jgi:hypothetical protein
MAEQVRQLSGTAPPVIGSELSLKRVRSLARSGGKIAQ